jgi:hypothetical protein
MKRLLLVGLALTAVGCSDAQLAKLGSLGNSAEAKCYSGGKMVFHGISTGVVHNEENSDGYFARWQTPLAEGKLSEPFFANISGTCIVVYR